MTVGDDLLKLQSKTSAMLDDIADHSDGIAALLYDPKVTRLSITRLRDLKVEAHAMTLRAASLERHLDGLLKMRSKGK